jgi:hypothetical protein
MPYAARPRERTVRQLQGQSVSAALPTPPPGAFPTAGPECGPADGRRASGRCRPPARLRLGHAAEEAHQRDPLLPGREVLQQRFERRAVLDALQHRFVRSQSARDSRSVVVGVGDGQGQRGVGGLCRGRRERQSQLLQAPRYVHRPALVAEVALDLVGQVPVHRDERPAASRPAAWTRGRLLASVGRDLACRLITAPGRARPRRGRRGIAAGLSCRARLATLSRRRRSPW